MDYLQRQNRRNSERVKRFENKKTDIFFINLNKSEKDFSPSTMYEDYAINDKLFHWQSQSQDRQASAKIQRYINHKNTGDIISLFVREFKRIGSYTAPYTFLGNADYVKHEGERPVSFVWKLHNSIPADMLPNSGTGKIYASALAMRELGFKRVLFLVHRVTLAKQAKKSFEKVFDKKVTMGLVGARNARKEDNRGRM